MAADAFLVRVGVSELILPGNAPENREVPVISCKNKAKIMWGKNDMKKHRRIFV